MTFDFYEMNKKGDDITTVLQPAPLRIDVKVTNWPGWLTPIIPALKRLR